jgi:rhodanese-related sulfurtransferase
MTEDITQDQARALAPLVTAGEAVARVAAGAVLVDVRSDAGRAQDGAAPAARVVAKDAIAQDGAAALDGVPKDAEIVLFCGSVHGSGPTARSLFQQGFTNVVHVDGGFPALKGAGIGA